ncbi:hypothetical protein ACIRFH_11445 [Streptomyces sp. NPDC093586]|uniref:hypothetical protein n=1 Tax=Streptomyces sp. NPDC093586 TaxID=3366042 RepID=UPI0038192C6B
MTPRRLLRRPGDERLEPDVAGPWADAVSCALVEHCGRWAVGWHWSQGEGDFDGGPDGFGPDR